MSTSKPSSPDQSSNPNQSWGGRFNEPVDDFVARFTASVSFDQRLYIQDIQGSVAHAAMLARVGVISEDDSLRIITGLESIKTDIANNQFDWSEALEDVHMNI
ncbi:MAG: lyase family protein, partial [Porticoccaceae bacterium]|nr:lyase family protein [Porticoccaceae bacterium]